VAKHPPKAELELSLLVGVRDALHLGDVAHAIVLPGEVEVGLARGWRAGFDPLRAEELRESVVRPPDAPRLVVPSLSVPRRNSCLPIARNSVTV
jgi:hypothetical protein